MASPADKLDARVTLVTDADDPRVGDYRHVREGDLVGRRGAFIVEGEMVLRALIERGRFPLRSVLLGRARLVTLEPWLERLAPGVPIYVAGSSVLEAIAGFDIHRGVLGLGDRTTEPDSAALLAGLGTGPRLVIALEALTNHDNVGGIFRSAAAFGADAVLLDERCCDPLYRKAIRVSIGAALCLPFARAGSSEAMLALLRAAGFVTLALSPRRDATDIVELRDPARMPERVALLLGTEGPGLSSGAMNGAERVVRIAIHPEIDAVNVSTAGAIAMHEYRSVYPLPRAPA
jgi:tRNA G18 (ribose-2'-O)-methylase SpoU